MRSASSVFEKKDQNGHLLFPPCIGDLIPDNAPVRVLDSIVGHLDISAVESTCKGGGARIFSPRMLLKVVLYPYPQNVYSGRKMEQFLRRDLHFMWLGGMQRPDFNTINLFRKNRLAGFIDEVFTRIVRMPVDAKFVSRDGLYIDGTKIEANADKYTFVWKKSAKINRDNLDFKVKSILREAEGQFDIELQESSDTVLTADEMERRTEEILSSMDAQGLSDKDLRKSVRTVKEESVPKMKEYEEKVSTAGWRGSYSKTDQ